MAQTPSHYINDDLEKEEKSDWEQWYQGTGHSNEDNRTQLVMFIKLSTNSSVEMTEAEILLFVNDYIAGSSL